MCTPNARSAASGVLKKATTSLIACASSTGRTYLCASVWVKASSENMGFPGRIMWNAIVN
eukprot:CAMPEP_0206042804 /NCGR_PEP_ID=MMETSP1466-20131121/6780_1 /ASSEMBLY_ACC=CAM_ASM_001126 /TAXON_ID=44452 /ORGANISM="Pavlova gyrans, Strain CCMP608" /LENGTH=59 /DNA_ID=CAMNT_0053417525 /DNA_START=513 /DNA_END=692 /DNA_ORIENTATION=-